MGNGGPGAGPPSKVGKVSLGPGPWHERTDDVLVGFMVRGGKGRAMEGLREWRMALQMVSASAQKVET